MVESSRHAHTTLAAPRAAAVSGSRERRPSSVRSVDSPRSDATPLVHGRHGPNDCVKSIRPPARHRPASTCSPDARPCDPSCALAASTGRAKDRGGRSAGGWLPVIAASSAMVPGVRAAEHDGKFVAFSCLIPVLVLLSGVLAGLTLGYMSLVRSSSVDAPLTTQDPTTLEVLSKTGTPKQRAQAAAIAPLRRNGHLLLVSLLCVPSLRALSADMSAASPTCSSMRHCLSLRTRSSAAASRPSWSVQRAPLELRPTLTLKHGHCVR